MSWMQKCLLFIYFELFRQFVTVNLNECMTSLFYMRFQKLHDSESSQRLDRAKIFCKKPNKIKSDKICIEF